MDENTISTFDKIQAKKLGITIEEYKEKKQTARTIYCKLFSDNKIMDMSLHMPINRGLIFTQAIGCMTFFYITLLLYNAIGNYELPTKAIIVLAIISVVIYIIGKFMMYHHDMKEFEKYVEKIAKWKDTPCKVNQFMVDCINRALEFKGRGECYGNTPIPFCSLHTKVADDGTKTYSLEFSGLSDWNYSKSIPLERMDYNYVVNTMRFELGVFMQEWAKNLAETELLVELEE